MSTSVLKKAAALATTAAFVFALAGCGGDSDKESTGSGSNPFANLASSDDAQPTDGAEPAETDDATGDDDTDTGSGDAGDCDMIDESTIASITGLPFEGVDPLAEDLGSGTFSCTWNVEGDSVAVFQVYVGSGEGQDMTVTREALGAMFDDVTDVSVSGADWAFSVMAGVIVGMAIDGDYVQVMFMDVFAEDTSSATLQLAEEVAANI